MVRGVRPASFPLPRPSPQEGGEYRGAKAGEFGAELWEDSGKAFGGGSMRPIDLLTLTERLQHHIDWSMREM
jgi:hypothetical protein